VYVNISWAAPARVNIFRTARKEQAVTLFLGLQPGPLNPNANHITHSVVALGTLPTNKAKTSVF
jgi:hypothetical protein